MPLHTQGHFLYNLVKAGHYEPEIFQRLEDEAPFVQSTSSSVREAMGGLWAYYKGNMGTVKGVEFWEKHFERTITFCTNYEKY